MVGTCLVGASLCSDRYCVSIAVLGSGESAVAVSAYEPLLFCNGFVTAKFGGGGRVGRDLSAYTTLLIYLLTYLSRRGGRLLLTRLLHSLAQ